MTSSSGSLWSAALVALAIATAILVAYAVARPSEYAGRVTPPPAPTVVSASATASTTWTPTPTPSPCLDDPLG